MTAGHLAGRMLRPTLSELWVFLAIALPVLGALLATLPTVDLAYQLRAGAGIIAGEGIPSEDTWTFTAAGLPWLDQQWGAQVVLGAVHGLAGWTGLAILRALMVALMTAFVLAAIRRTAPAMRPRTAALLTVAAFIVMSPALALRPQLFGLVLFAATLFVLAGRADRDRWLWTLPVIAMAWANVHGSFILAPVLVGLACLEDLVARRTVARRMVVATALTAALTLVNPFGFGVWEYAFGLATNREVTARISEWQAPTLGSPFGALFWVSVVLVVLAAVALIRRRSEIPLVALITLAGFAALGAIAERGIAWWAVIAAITVAGLTAQGRSAADTTGAIDGVPAREHGRLINAVLAGAIIIVGIVLVPAWRPIDQGLDAPTGLLGQAPSGITGVLRDVATPSDRIWNPQVWGSWFEFAVPVATYGFDARIEVIPGDAWETNQRVDQAEAGWSEELDSADVTIVVIAGPPTSPLPAALSTDSAWRLAYADSDGSIWVRSDR